MGAWTLPLVATKWLVSAFMFMHVAPWHVV